MRQRSAWDYEINVYWSRNVLHRDAIWFFVINHQQTDKFSQSLDKPKSQFCIRCDLKTALNNHWSQFIQAFFVNFNI